MSKSKLTAHWFVCHGKDLEFCLYLMLIALDCNSFSYFYMIEMKGYLLCFTD